MTERLSPEFSPLCKLLVLFPLQPPNSLVPIQFAASKMKDNSKVHFGFYRQTKSSPRIPRWKCCRWAHRNIGAEMTYLHCCVVVLLFIDNRHFNMNSLHLVSNCPTHVKWIPVKFIPAISQITFLFLSEMSCSYWMDFHYMWYTHPYFYQDKWL